MHADKTTETARGSKEAESTNDAVAEKEREAKGTRENGKLETGMGKAKSTNA